MAVHPDMADPPNFSGRGSFTCPKCELVNADGALVTFWPEMFVLNAFGQLTGADAENATGLWEGPWLQRQCMCGYSWPERTDDNPRIP